jgi:hypothetical protein
LPVGAEAVAEGAALDSSLTLAAPIETSGNANIPTSTNDLNLFIFVFSP